MTNAAKTLKPTRDINDPVCFSESASCLSLDLQDALQDAVEMAALSSQRLDDFMADEPPFYTRGTTVSASRKAMKQTIKDFDKMLDEA